MVTQEGPKLFEPLNPPVEGVTPNPSASEAIATTAYISCRLRVGPSAQAMLFNVNLLTIIFVFSAQGTYALTLSTADGPTLSQVPSCIQGCAQSALQTAGGSCASMSVSFLCRLV